jgi:hypothetical protein
MTASVVKTTIMAKLASVLPALLSTASLDNFTDYLDEQPNKTDALQLGIYIIDETDTVDSHVLTVLIQGQLYSQGDWKQKYNDVIMPAIREHITASLVGYNVRERIMADLWPVDVNGSSFAYYEIEFSEVLDDCDY